ncbi:MAG: xylosidase/arabinosidase [bacterium]|nr:xylosidase/arabinosidase [bacterium]
MNWDSARCGALLAPTLLLLTVGAAAAQTVDPSTIEGKVLFGYQGWFNCPGDGSDRGWRSWSRGTPNAGTLTIDMYPDLSELDADELCPVPEMTIGGKQAYVYLAWNPKTVVRHFQWMKEYGLDGVLAQRFVTQIERRRSGGDVLLKNVMAGAERSGRVFSVEYDVASANQETFWETMREDWKYLVDVLKVTSHPNYLHHNGKPVLSVWGMGLDTDRHPPRSPEVAKQVIEWFQRGAPEKYRVTYMGGTPSRWRTLTNDCNPDPGWAEVFRMMDIIQPWTVGRYRNTDSADQWKKDMIEPDLALTRENGQIYMPVVFPGFSWHNLQRNRPERNNEKNRIPRNGGKFLWRQAHNARAAGATVLKIAMFDEVNEATAMYKLAAKPRDAPDQGYWLTLDADGYDLPSDWYLRLAAEITRIFHGEMPLSPEIPEKPGPPAEETRR